MKEQSMTKRILLTKRQREVMTIIRDSGSECWGDVWTHYAGQSALDFRNFDRVADAVVRKGLVTEDPLTLTNAGRKALEP